MVTMEEHSTRKHDFETERTKIELQTVAVAAYRKLTGYKGFGNMMPDDDDHILQRPGAGEYAKAKYALFKYCLENPSAEREAMNLGNLFRVFAKTVALALPEKAEEAIEVMKNAATSCIAKKDEAYAARAMLGVGLAFGEIAKCKSVSQSQIAAAVGEIIAADKTARRFGVADNLKFSIQRSGLSSILPEETKKGNIPSISKVYE